MTDSKKAFPISSTLKVGNLVFISGQVGITPTTGTLISGNFEDEVKQTMENLQTELQAHDLNLEHLVSVIVYLKDMNNYKILNKIYASYFDGKFPTRTCITVANLPVNASVEISGIAYIN